MVFEGRGSASGTSSQPHAPPSSPQVTPKSPAPRPRKLVISETHVTERDIATYAIITARPLAAVANVVRHWDDPQRFTVEYRDGSGRTYISPLRDALLGAIVDACRNSGNATVGVSVEPTRPGDRMGPPAALTAVEDADLAAVYIEAIRRAAKAGAAAPGGPYNAALVRAAAELSSNVSPAGLAYAFKKGPVVAVIPDVAAVRRSGD